MSSRQKLETLWNSQLNELLAKKKNNNEAKKETNEAIEKYKIQSAQGLALRMLIADIQHVKTTDRLCGMRSIRIICKGIYRQRGMYKSSVTVIRSWCVSLNR